ncbi:unnamed protein product, partial [Rotaria sp. Silwood1]
MNKKDTGDENTGTEGTLSNTDDDDNVENANELPNKKPIAKFGSEPGKTNKVTSKKGINQENENETKDESDAMASGKKYLTVRKGKAVGSSKKDSEKEIKAKGDHNLSE